ncbi:MAG: carbamoyl-phosphate synthase large subunit, partial [Planctomycetota bacterium]|nr:carbamoyl-phosphate synthase large subunit [Planctomycetota bacterium]
SFQKALRGLEVGRFGLGCDSKDRWGRADQPTIDEIRAKLATPNQDRAWFIRYAIKTGMSLDEIFELSGIDPWFLDQIKQIIELEDELRGIGGLAAVAAPQMRRAKQTGFSDRQLATIWRSAEQEVRARRKELGVRATFKSVDTCAAEFEAYTPYYYSTYEDEDETPPKHSDKKRVMILGGGPNRIGQGIEFDYCCCHASFALAELGIESIMVNSNPETVSTDYDTSDLLFFEPLTTEDVLNIFDRVQPDGVIVQYGGQTPLNLVRALANEGVPIIGTSVDTIEAAEDREKFQALLRRLGLRQPANGIARTMDEARAEAKKIDYPLLVRPSFVLGGRAMEICYDQEQMEHFVKKAFEVAQGQPVLIDRFLEDATEVDVDCIFDGETALIAGVMEHIEEAGVHSGDSACAIPPYSLPGPVVAEIHAATEAMARELRVHGLMNVQFAVKKEGDRQNVYVIEVNPRASRTVPFVAKATGMPVAKVAAKIMAGQVLSEPVTLASLGYESNPIPSHVSVKESVFPFIKFAGVDIVLGPEMKSTGEVMGISPRFSIAFAKSQLSAGVNLPREGKIFVSVADRTKDAIVPLARRLITMGYEILSTSGTARRLQEEGVEVTLLKKLQEGHPNLLDYLANEDVQLIFNTPSGKGARTDEGRIRAACVAHGVPCITTVQAADACVLAMEALREEELNVQSLQQRFAVDAGIDDPSQSEVTSGVK